MSFDPIQPANTIASNIQFLNERSKWHKYKFTEEGLLQKMSFCDRIVYRFSKERHETFKTQFADFIRSIQVGSNGVTDDQISKLFSVTLAGRSRKLFKRDIDESVFHLVKNNLVEANIKGEKDEDKIKIAKDARVWMSLGSFEANTGGCATSYRVIQGNARDGSDEHIEHTLGIFKPSSGESLAPQNKKLGQRIKRVIIPRLPAFLKGSLMDTNTGQGYIGEVVQKRIADRVLTYVEQYKQENPGKQAACDMLLGGLVENTAAVEFSKGSKTPEAGSFQEWVQAPHQDASAYLGIRKNYKGRGNGNQLAPELFDMIAIINVVTGNCDGHAKNWFVLEDDEGKASGIRMFDGGWSMAPTNPISKRAIEVGNMYQWANFAGADREFTPLSKYVITQLGINRKEIEDEIKELYEEFMPQDLETALPHEVSDGHIRAQSMRHRIEAMHNYVYGIPKENERYTVKGLGKIKTDSQIASLRQP